ncbi:hypothetical protein M3A74_07755 [Corynebacterium appendicis]|uniref:hypothetical protein n=1 Tax=Corynebacterium appendicis TaxID=163202 RepID=UPI00223C2519|nr:hypothetical protein [Corynebacterium appendicis]MCT1684697.1 hypothetical protein [Corynebacterium appendicis]
MITAITREDGSAYFDNQPIHARRPGDDFDDIVPGHEPTVEESGEWAIHNWDLEAANGNILHIRLVASESQTTYTVYTPDSGCKPE